MRKTVLILAFLLTLFCLFSCQKEEIKETIHSPLLPETILKTEEETETKKETSPVVTEEEKNSNNYKVEDKSVKEKLAAIPIANNSMTTDELRQICVDFFRLQLSFTWMPGTTLARKELTVTREPGTVYGGLPYVSEASGNLYRAMDYYDEETGVIDVSSFLENPNYFGNACSGSAFWAWFRVVNSFRVDDGAFTRNLTHLNGAIRVGPYTYRDVQNFHGANEEVKGKYTATEAVLENDEQTMYESYALTKIADGLAHSGHVRMISASPVIVRNEDRTIDGEKSFLLYCDQVQYVHETFHNATQTDGTPYKIQGGIDVKITFKELFDTYYIPFTFAEFQGTDPVEQADVSVGITSDAFTLEELLSDSGKSNYPWSHAYITITSSTGEEVYRRIHYSEGHYNLNIKTSKIILAEDRKAIRQHEESATHTLKVSMQLSNGEILNVYEGIITK